MNGSLSHPLIGWLAMSDGANFWLMLNPETPLIIKRLGDWTFSYSILLQNNFILLQNIEWKFIFIKRENSERFVCVCVDLIRPC